MLIFQQSMETIYEEDYSSPDHLPGYVSPSFSKNHLPKTNRTILNNTEGAALQAVQYDLVDDTDDRWLEKAWKKHEAMKAEFLDITRLIHNRDNNRKMATGSPMQKTVRSHLSRIPLPTFWFHQAKECPAALSRQLKTVEPSRAKASRIPVPVYMVGPTKQCAHLDVQISPSSPAAKPSQIPLPSEAMRCGQLYPQPSAQEIPCSVYHTPGKHVTIIPQSQDSLLRQSKTRLPVWMNTLRMSRIKSGMEDGRFCLGHRHSNIPVPVSQIQLIKDKCKMSPIKRAKRAIVKKLRNLSPRCSLQSLNKIFKRPS